MEEACVAAVTPSQPSSMVSLSEAKAKPGRTSCLHIALSGDFAVGRSWLSNTFDHIYIGIKPFTTWTDHKSLQ